MENGTSNGARAEEGKTSANVARFGLLRIGKVGIAVAAEALLEIVPRGSVLHACPIPSRGFEVRGTLLHRGVGVPVLNVAGLLGTELGLGEQGDSGKTPTVALIRSGETIVGLLIDEAVRVSDPAGSSVIQLQGEGLDASLFRSYLGNHDQLWYVLEPEALVACLSSRSPSASVKKGKEETDSGAKGGERALIAVVRWGEYVFGIRSQWVVSAMPASELQDTGMDDTLVRGFLPFQEELGKAIAVIHFSPFLGLPMKEQEKQEKPAQYLHLGDEKRHVAFGISSVCGLDYLEVNHLEPIHLRGIRHAELFEGALFSKRYGQMLILDGAAILDAPCLQGMVNPPPPPKQDDLVEWDEEWRSEEEEVKPVEEVKAEPCTFVVYRTAQSFYATTTAELDGIVLKPQLYAKLGHTHNAMEGFLHWRGTSIPVLNLTRCLGFEISPSRSGSEWILIHRRDQKLIGFLVEAVDSLTLAAPTTIPAQVAERRDQHVRLSTPILPPSQAISFKDGKITKTAFVLDLGSVDTLSEKADKRA